MPVGTEVRSRALIETKGFHFVAIEGDWPDAARIDHYVRHREYRPSEWTAFSRFPTWMWRNNEVRSFVDWLRDYNAARKPQTRTAFHGLDLYSLYDSIRFVLQYLDEVDPPSAKVARERYGRAAQLMSGFARRTGLYPESQKERRRYLWTDAFAVCNFIELFVQTGNEFYRQCATDLIDQVHHVLGQYRADDFRHGWISGLDEEAGKRHPTMGGLRIGKPLRERQAKAATSGSPF